MDKVKEKGKKSVEVPSILKAWQKTQAIRQLIQEGKK